jgi:hypothetical protein
MCFDDTTLLTLLIASKFNSTLCELQSKRHFAKKKRQFVLAAHGFNRAETAGGTSACLRFLALFIRKMEFWRSPFGGIVMSRNREFIANRCFQVG